MAEGSPHVLPNLPRVVADARRGAMHYEPICSVFRRYLHQQNLKFTPERARILDAALRKEGLFDPEALIDDTKKMAEHVSRATVYRTLNHLQDAGIVKQVFFDNKQSYFEVIAGRQTHDYLICVATGKVIEFNSERLRRLRNDICKDHGFDPISHRFQIFGLSAEGRAMGPDGEAGEGPVKGGGKRGRRGR